MTITISTTINAPIETVWEYWTAPEHIEQWNHASEDWECPHAQNDLSVGGTFTARMASKDGTQGFDFKGTYTSITPYTHIAYTIEDGRKVTVTFETVTDRGTEVVESFETEDENSPELQRTGWQAILDNFKTYVESTHHAKNSSTSLV